MGWFDHIKAAANATDTAAGVDPRFPAATLPPQPPKQDFFETIKQSANATDVAAGRDPRFAPPSPAAPATPAAPAGGTHLTLDQIAQQFKAKYPDGTVNAAAMEDLFNTLQANGFDVKKIPHGDGFSADKYMVNGQMYDFGSGIDSGKGSFWPSWSPVPQGGEQAALAGSGAIGINELGDRGLLQTYGKEYAPPDWTKLGPPQDWTKEFKPPTADEVRNTQGYQFALNEGLHGMETGAAARGVGLTSGFQKDKLAFATGLADQTYQGAYQRALGEYQQAYNIFRGNQSALATGASTERNLGQGEFLTNYNIWSGDRNNIYNRLKGVSDSGLSAADKATS